MQISVIKVHQKCLKDLNMALKNPDGDFVFMQDAKVILKHKRIPTMGENISKQKK